LDCWTLLDDATECRTRGIVQQSPGSAACPSYIATSAAGKPNTTEVNMPGHEDALFVDSVPHEAFKCMICLLTADNPVICKNQHLYCRTCISQWLAQQQACPTCKEGLTVGTLTPNRTAADYIADCRVRCDSNLGSFQEDTPAAKKQKSGASSAAIVGCDWVGKMCELNQHKESCEYVEVECGYGGGCEWKGRRDAAEEHEARCDYRMEGCQHCYEFCKVRSMKAHVKGCRRRPVVCKNTGCDTFYPHEDRKEHMQVCSKHRIKCPHHESLSCSFACAREDMPAHAENAAAHFKSMLGAIQSIRVENRALVNENRAMVNENKVLVEKVNALEGKVDNLAEAAEWGQGTLEWRGIVPSGNTFSRFTQASKRQRVLDFEWKVHLKTVDDEVRLYLQVIRGAVCNVEATARLYSVTTAPVAERLVGQVTLTKTYDNNEGWHRVSMIGLADIDKFAKNGHSFTLITTASFSPLFAPSPDTWDSSDA
jgi:hypothetical protein